MVSVIIPTYNRARLIERSVNSVLNQTYSDLEVIVVDDCSTDNTADIIKSMMGTDSRLKYYRMEENSGACAARNKGIELSRGEYIAFQDSDDEWLPDKLQVQVSEMEKSSAKISFCQFIKYDGNGEHIFPMAQEGFLKREQILNESIVSTQTMIGCRQCFDGIRFDPSMPRMQDYDLCINLSRNFDFLFIAEPLVKIYLQDDSISTNWDKLLVALEKIKQKYPKELEEYPLMDLFVSGHICNAKVIKGLDCVKDAFYCLKLKPSKITIKLFVKAIMTKAGIIKIKK